MAKTDKKLIEFWLGHVRGFKASGLTRKAYCAQHGLSGPNLYYWSKKNQKSVGSSFLPVVVSPSTPTTVEVLPGTLRIVLRDGTVIESRGGDLATIVKLTNQLRSGTP